MLSLNRQREYRRWTNRNFLSQEYLFVYQLFIGHFREFSNGFRMIWLIKMTWLIKMSVTVRARILVQACVPEWGMTFLGVQTWHAIVLAYWHGTYCFSSVSHSRTHVCKNARARTRTRGQGPALRLVSVRNLLSFHWTDTFWRMTWTVESQLILEVAASHSNSGSITAW